jgi:uncharacterized protein YggE
MRLVITGFALALWASGAFAQPVTTAPLGPREILLETSGEGVVRSPADRVSLLVPLHGSAATITLARNALSRSEERVVAAARSAGVSADDIREFHPGGPFGMAGNEAMMTAASEQQTEGDKAVHKTLEIRLRDPAQAEALRAALEAGGIGDIGDPIYSLADDSAARHAARDQGIARARASAEVYATSLNMRVGRIVRISDRPTAETASIDMMQSMFQRMMGRGGGPDPMVETNIRVAVDFALVPQ